MKSACFKPHPFKVFVRLWAQFKNAKEKLT